MMKTIVINDTFNTTLPVVNGVCDLNFRMFDIIHGILQDGTKFHCEIVSPLTTEKGNTSVYDCNDIVCINGVTVFRPDYKMPIPVYLMTYKNMFIETRRKDLSSITLLVSKFSNNDTPLYPNNMDVLNDNVYYSVGFSGNTGIMERNITCFVPLLCNDMDKHFNRVWLKLIHSFYTQNDRDEAISTCKTYYEYLTMNNKISYDLYISILHYFLSYVKKLTPSERIKNILHEIETFTISSPTIDTYLNIMIRVTDFCRMVLMENRTIAEDYMIMLS